MCLPGTAEIVGSESRRTGRRRSTGARPFWAPPGRREPRSPRAFRRPRSRTDAGAARTASATSRTCSPKASPSSPRLAGARDDLRLRDRRLLLAEMDVRRALGNAHGRPGPLHPGGRLSPEITPPELIVPIVVIDISQKARHEPERDGRPSTTSAFRAGARKLPDGALVAVDSGWAARSATRSRSRAASPFPNYHFPGFGLEAAMWLVGNRDVTGIGVDTLSLDPGNSSTFPVHVNFLAPTGTGSRT